MDHKIILEVKDLCLKLDNTQILDHLNMQVWQGYVHAIIGPNGAGKSTLASTITALSGYKYQSGSIIFNNKPIDDLSIEKRAGLGITLAWQEPARFEGITIKKYLTLSTHGNNDPDKIASEALEQVGLLPKVYLNRYVDKTLSGGERKRVELASILTINPKLVLMDEPDSGIDVDALKRIQEAVEILKKRGTTVLLITHSNTVLNWADHAFLMCCGRVVEKGGIKKISHFFEDKCIPCDHKNRPVEILDV